MSEEEVETPTHWKPIALPRGKNIPLKLFEDVAAYIVHTWDRGESPGFHVYTKIPHIFFDVFEQYASEHGANNDWGNGKLLYFNCAEETMFASSFDQQIRFSGPLCRICIFIAPPKSFDQSVFSYPRKTEFITVTSKGWSEAKPKSSNILQKK